MISLQQFPRRGNVPPFEATIRLRRAMSILAWGTSYCAPLIFQAKGTLPK
jgi:hypothetical protein